MAWDLCAAAAAWAPHWVDGPHRTINKANSKRCNKRLKLCNNSFGKPARSKGSKAPTPQGHGVVSARPKRKRQSKRRSAEQPKPRRRGKRSKSKGRAERARGTEEEPSWGPKQAPAPKLGLASAERLAIPGPPSAGPPFSPPVSLGASPRFSRPPPRACA